MKSHGVFNIMKNLEEHAQRSDLPPVHKIALKTLKLKNEKALPKIKNLHLALQTELMIAHDEMG